MAEATHQRVGAWTVARLFLRLGVTAFGGPAAHVALMEEEFVRRRRWLTQEEFLDLVGATQLIPGPNSTELAMHLGLRRAGWPGFFAAGIGFILPAALIVTALAWAYLRFGSLPAIASLLYGVKPVIVAVVGQALWRLGRTAVKTRFLAMLGLAAALATFLGMSELLVLFAAGTLVMAARAARRDQRDKLHGLAAAPALLAASTAAHAATVPAIFGLWPLFLFFLKVGSVLFGSGYVLLAFLRADLVERWGWITESQLLDAIAIGQVTPGPVFTTATFIGYLLGGGAGAAVATVGIFLPAFVFVALSGPLVPRLRKSPLAGAFLDGVNVASLALMAVVTLQLSRAALVDGVTISLACVAAWLIIVRRLNATWIVLGGGVIGCLVQLLRS